MLGRPAEQHRGTRRPAGQCKGHGLTRWQACQPKQLELTGQRVSPRTHEYSPRMPSSRPMRVSASQVPLYRGPAAQQ